MLLKLLAGIVVIAVNRDVFQRPVHASHLAIRPRMIGLGQAVLNAMCSSDTVKHMLEGVLLMRLVGELNAVVRQNCVDTIGHCGNQPLQKSSSDGPRHSFMQLSKHELGGTVDGHEQVENALFRSQLRNVDVKVTDRVALEALLLRWAVRYLWQPADPVPLQTAVQGGAGQMRYGLLQCIQAAIEGQQRVLAEPVRNLMLLAK